MKDEKWDSMPFEAAMEKLEAIVEAMEAGDLALETLLARYEEGNRLVRACQRKLADAELRMKKLEKTAGGELELRPIPAEPDEEDG